MFSAVVRAAAPEPQAEERADEGQEPSNPHLACALLNLRLRTKCPTWKVPLKAGKDAYRAGQVAGGQTSSPHLVYFPKHLQLNKRVPKADTGDINTQTSTG